MIEPFIVAAALIASAVGVLYVRRLVRRSGRDRPHDPERVGRFVDRGLSDR